VTWTSIAIGVQYQKIGKYHVIKVTNRSPRADMEAPNIVPYAMPYRDMPPARKRAYLSAIVERYAPKESGGQHLVAAISSTFFNFGSAAILGPMGGRKGQVLEDGNTDGKLLETRRYYFGRCGLDGPNGQKAYIVQHVQYAPNHTGGYLFSLPTPVEYFIGGGGVLLTHGVLGNDSTLHPNWTGDYKAKPPPTNIIDNMLGRQAGGSVCRAAIGITMNIDGQSETYPAAAYLVVVTGTDTAGTPELGNWMRDHLGVRNALFLDGSDSAQMCLRKASSTARTRKWETQFFAKWSRPKKAKPGTLITRQLPSAVLVYGSLLQ
jgi:hypothetical protein